MKVRQVMLTEPEIKRVLALLEEQPQQHSDKRLFEKLHAALRRARQGCGEVE